MFPNPSNPAQSQTVIVLVGVPGSGKSTVAQQLVQQHGFLSINQDTLGDRRACEQAFMAALSAGHNIVIDRCNVDASQRRVWLNLLRSCAAAAQRARLVAMQLLIPVHECQERVRRRVGHPTLGPEGADTVVPRFAQDFQHATYREGFHEVFTAYASHELPGILQQITSVAVAADPFAGYGGSSSGAQGWQPQPEAQTWQPRPQGRWDARSRQQWLQQRGGWQGSGASGWQQPQEQPWGAPAGAPFGGPRPLVMRSGAFAAHELEQQQMAHLGHGGAPPHYQPHQGNSFGSPPLKRPALNPQGVSAPVIVLDGADEAPGGARGGHASRGGGRGAGGHPPVIVLDGADGGPPGPRPGRGGGDGGGGRGGRGRGRKPPIPNPFADPASTTPYDLASVPLVPPPADMVPAADAPAADAEGEQQGQEAKAQEGPEEVQAQQQDQQQEEANGAQEQPQKQLEQQQEDLTAEEQEQPQQPGEQQQQPGEQQPDEVKEPQELEQEQGQQQQRGPRDPRIILLFDLNGTLTSHTAKRYSAGTNRMRPGLQALARLTQRFRLGIYTSSTLRTVTTVRGLVEAAAGVGPGGLIEPGLVLFREHTQPVPAHHVVNGGNAWDTVKPLDRWFSRLDRVVLFDDDAFKAMPGEESNMVVVPCWGEDEDPACPVLQQLAEVVEEVLGSLPGDADVRQHTATISQRLAACMEAHKAAKATADAAAAAAAPAAAGAADGVDSELVVPGPYPEEEDEDDEALGGLKEGDAAAAGATAAAAAVPVLTVARDEAEIDLTDVL